MQQRCKCPECKQHYEATVTEDCPHNGDVFLLFCEACIERVYWRLGWFRAPALWRRTHGKRKRSTWKQNMKDFEDYE